MELSQGFKQLYYFKRQIYHASGFGTHFEDMMIQLSSESIATTPWVSGVAMDEKKALFCVVDADDALTAQIYQDSLDHVTSKTNFIWIHHHTHKVRGIQDTIKDIDIHLYSLGPNLCVAHIGKRLQSLSRGAGPTLYWPKTISESVSGPVLENRPWVETLESLCIADGKALLGPSDERLFDRALIYWCDLESSALRELLITQYHLSPNHIECLSLHRWNELRLLHQFEKRGYSHEMFRGLLLLSAELSRDPTIESKLTKACIHLRDLQKPS
jgi:hypothetical protein